MTSPIEFLPKTVNTAQLSNSDAHTLKLINKMPGGVHIDASQALLADAELHFGAALKQAHAAHGADLPNLGIDLKQGHTADSGASPSPTFADAVFTVATATAETLAVPIVGAAIGFTVLEAGTVAGALAAGAAAGVLAGAAGLYLFDGNDLPRFSKDLKSDYEVLISRL